LIKHQVEHFFKGKVEILDSASIVAEEVENTLRAKDLLTTEQSANHSFYISDFTKSFESSTRIFFGEKLHLEEARIWD
jgi:glutamate racemase